MGMDTVGSLHHSCVYQFNASMINEGEEIESIAYFINPSVDIQYLEELKYRAGQS